MTDKKPNIGEPSPEALHLWALMKDVFVLNENGTNLLKLLKEMFFDLPVCPPGCKEGYGYYREGQNDVFRYIERCLKQYESYTKNSGVK
jgi:hypothetical protein